MKRTLAAAALTAALAMAGCSEDSVPETGAASAEVAATDASSAAAPASVSAAPEAPSAPALPAAPGAPPFAVIYPGGAPSGPPTVAQGPEGPGGIVSFTTDASPDAIIAYYRRAAEAAGLASVMAMNQGDARAYGAAADDGSGRLLRVVATPMETGGTDVQLDWTAGG